MTQKRLSSISSSVEIFNEIEVPYENVTKKSGFKCNLTYVKQTITLIMMIIIIILTIIMIFTVTVIILNITLKRRKVISLVIAVCCGITHHTVLGST